MRWREALVGGGLALFGLWLVLGPGFLLAILGYALMLTGALLAWIGVQRGRFRTGSGGAGAVQIVEGQVTYFGPLTGGAIALGEIDQLVLNGKMYPAHWQIAQDGKQPLLIPVNAAGADALFDAYARLPGFPTEHMLAVLRESPPQEVLIWERTPRSPKGALPH